MGRLLSGLVGAIGWNLFTFYAGLPTSSSHALVGGIAGGAVARFGPDVLISSGLRKIGVFIVLSPAHRVGPGDGVHDCGVVDI